MSSRTSLFALALCLLPTLLPAAEPESAPATSEPAPPATPAAAEDAARPAAAAEALVTTDREAEYARIAPRLAAGDELQWLEAAGRKFVALLRKPRQGPPRGGVLIVPAPQELVDRREVIHRLRTLPPAGGFVTLALQPPLGVVPPTAAAPATDPAAPPVADAAPADEKAPEAAPSTAALPLHPDFCPRVAAGLAALETALAADATDGQPPLLAIAAAEASVPAVLGCHADGLPAGVRAFAALGRWQGDFGPLAVPAIEFVPLRDPIAVQAADARAALPLAPETPPRRRVDIDGVDARFEGAGEDVAKRLRGWLERLPPPAMAKGTAGRPPPVSS